MMMTARRHNLRAKAKRGLSLLELMLALTITALVAGAIASMMAAVGTGVGTRRDVRNSMIHAAASQSRLNSYIAPARCLLDAGESELVIWLDDTRPGGTIHATELRWMRFDAITGTLRVYFVAFPDTWTESAKDLADKQFSKTADWHQVFRYYDDNGHMAEFELDDGLDSLAITLDYPGSPLTSRHVTFDFEYVDRDRTVPITIASTIRYQQLPIR